MNPKALHIEPERIVSIFFLAALILCLFFSPVKLLAQGNPTFDNGKLTTTVPMPPTGCVYTWTNNNPAIGLPASGTGDIAPFMAVNAGVAPIVATITAKPTPVYPPTYITYADHVSVVDPVTKKEITTIPIASGFLQGKSPDGSTLYFVSTANRNLLYVVNAITNTITATIAVPLGIAGVIVSPDGKKIYAVNSSGSYVTVIDAASNSISTTIDLGASYNGSLPVFSQDGSKLYFFNQIGNTVAALNTATNTVIYKLTIPRPVLFKESKDGTKAFVGSVSNSTLTIFDTATGAILSSFDLGGTPNQMLMSPDGSALYFKFYGIDRIVTVDTKTLVSSDFLPVISGNISFSPDSKYIYFYDTVSGSVTVYDVAAKIVLTKITTADLPENSGLWLYASGIVVGYDGKYVYVNHTVHNFYGPTNYSYLSVISTQSNTVVETIPDGVVPLQAKGPANCDGPAVVFTITINPPPPDIFSAGTLVSLNTTYGTPSAPTSFTVSGDKIFEGILVTPPAGFEVSTDNVTYTDNIKVGNSGLVAPTKVYVRLKASVGVGPYSGNIVLSNGATSVNVATLNSEVTAVPLTITAKTVTKTYGSVLTDGPGSVDFTAMGLMNGETVGSVSMSYGTGASATDIVKTYIGSATPSAATGGTFSVANYSPVNYLAGNLVVTPAALTITADNKTKFYGEAIPPLTVTYSGFVNNEDATQLSILPIISTTAVLSSPIGQYPITATGTIGTNYTITYIAGQLIITPKIVTAANAFTPNGDGINDTWEIQNIGEYPNCVVEVFNRYGEKMFYSTGYPVAWAGKRNGATLPVGTYYYIIKLGDGSKPLTGYLAIIR